MNVDWSKVPIAQSYDDLFKHYGNPNHPDFESEYIVTTRHFLASGKSIKVRSHIAMVPHLHNVFLFASHLINTYDGCFNIRLVRGGTKPSIHSWGLAIDVNANDFPLGSHSKQNMDLVNAFVDNGFFPGQQFKHRPDPMHFQLTGDF